MKSFFVHVSDAHGIDEQTAVIVSDSMDLGRAAQLALDEIVEKHGSNISFPVFIDIQRSTEFQDRAWMHAGPARTVPSLGV